MLVREIMSTNPHYCTLDQHASDAVRKMEEFDIGCVPIVDASWSPIAMVTDRDIALASYRCNCPPQALELRSVMSSGVFTCKTDDRLADAERTMRDWQVRRLPVVDEDGRLVGMLSLNDIALAADKSPLRLRGQLEETLAAVCRHRPPPVGMQI